MEKNNLGTEFKAQERKEDTVNSIGKGIEITGDINTHGDIEIDGILNGNIVTDGKLVVGKNGKIVGEIECKNSEILGVINGKIKVKELLSLKNSAKLYGDMITEELSVEPGSTFTGNCKMNNVAEQESFSEAKKENGQDRQNEQQQKKNAKKKGTFKK